MIKNVSMASSLCFPMDWVAKIGMPIKRLLCLTHRYSGTGVWYCMSGTLTCIYHLPMPSQLYTLSVTGESVTSATIAAGQDDCLPKLVRLHPLLSFPVQVMFLMLYVLMLLWCFFAPHTVFLLKNTVWECFSFSPLSTIPTEYGEACQKNLGR